MEETNQTKKTNNKTLIIVGVLIIIVGGCYIFSQLGKSNSIKNNNQGQQNPQEQVGESEIPNPEVPAIKDGVVQTPEGEPARNDAEPGAPEAPRQSAPISEDEIPANSIKITMTAEGINPKEFTVKAGSLVTLAVTSGDEWTHVFAFKDPSLSAVAVGLSGGETRSITFNAPTKKGEYEIYCNVPGHEARGEVAKMIVN